MQTELQEIIETSFIKALEHDSKGNIGQAYAYYNAVLELCPQKRKQLEKRFTTILCEWGIILEQKNRFEDLKKCYENSLKIFPESPMMLNNFSAHLLRNEEPIQAIKYLKAALNINPNFLPAERNLQNAFSMVVDRWHFSMLNDQSRNQAFEKAIKKKILLGHDTVLDIGTGTGLLSLYASNAGAKKIYACEYSPTMCDIAKKVFHKNNVENVKLICKASSDIKIPTDIDKRVKLIVTEIFDAALFGELVVPTLIDAHENLLETNGSGIIIPMHATLYIAAVECEYIRFRSAVLFDQAHNFGSLKIKDVIILPDEEYYDTENLQNVNLNYITEPKSLIKINFNDLQELKNYMTDGIKETINGTCRYNGIIDALVAWFKLDLDESITLDSSQGKSCWQLAVFPAYSQQVKANDQLIISAEIVNKKLKCFYQLRQDQIEDNELVYHLPRDVICFLNDKEYISCLINAAKSKEQGTIKTVFDSSPFPIYGLTILKEHPDCETLYYQTKNPALMHLILHVLKVNNINGRVNFVDDFNEILCTLDSMYVHNFDIKGELIDCGQQSFREMYSCSLSPNGTLHPAKIFLMGQFVYSEELPKMVEVRDENLQNIQELNLSNDEASVGKKENKDGICVNKIESVSQGIISKTNFQCKIADFINEYKINQVFDLNSSLYNYIAITESKTLTEMDESEMKEEIINFGKISLESNQNIPNALICWYKICITDDIMLETIRNNSFMNHTAIVFENELHEKVSNGKDVNIRINQMHDLIKIRLDP